MPSLCLLCDLLASGEQSSSAGARPAAPKLWLTSLLPMATLGAFKDGRLVYCGSSHGHLCQQDEAALRRMRSMLVAEAA